MIGHDHPHGKGFKGFYDDLKYHIDKLGQTCEDKRLNRTVKRLLVVGTVAAMDIIQELKREETLDKYNDDYQRMKPTLDLAIRKAIVDKSSRQLVVLNTDNFMEVQQCFQLMQFIFNGKGWMATVFQRSADLSKLKDDMVFFTRLIMDFELGTGYTVEMLDIHFTDLHYEI